MDIAYAVRFENTIKGVLTTLLISKVLKARTMGVCPCFALGSYKDLNSDTAFRRRTLRASTIFPCRHNILNTVMANLVPGTLFLKPKMESISAFMAALIAGQN